MPNLTNHGANCGMKDLTIGWDYDDYIKPKVVLKWFCKSHCQEKVFYGSGLKTNFKIPCSHLVFSQAIHPRDGIAAYGENLAKFIIRHKLGHIARSKPAPNPVHGPNTITAYIWTLDEKALKTWWNQNKE